MITKVNYCICNRRSNYNGNEREKHLIVIVVLLDEHDIFFLAEEKSRIKLIVVPVHRYPLKFPLFSNWIGYYNYTEEGKKVWMIKLHVSCKPGKYDRGYRPVWQGIHRGHCSFDFSPV